MNEWLDEWTNVCGKDEQFKQKLFGYYLTSTAGVLMFISIVLHALVIMSKMGSQSTVGLGWTHACYCRYVITPYSQSSNPHSQPNPNNMLSFNIANLTSSSPRILYYAWLFPWHPCDECIFYMWSKYDGEILDNMIILVTPLQ